ncbi:MAG TPA: glycosyltransferase family 4 protein [Candidatus Thermoplasmatota archaeon]
MRIAFTVPNFRPRLTGPALLVEEVAKRLVEKGHSCLLITRNGGKAEAPRGVEVAPLAAHSRSGYPKRSDVTSALSRFRPDLVFTHEMRNPLTMWGAAWSARERVALAIEPHGEWNAYRAMPHRWQRFPFAAYDAIRMRGFPSRGSKIVATSKAEEAELAKTTGRSSDVVRLYLGANAKPAPSPSRRDVPRILMFANFGVFRDPWPLIKASKRLQEMHVAHELVLAGGFAPHSIFQRRLRVPSDADARYVGPVETSERNSVLANADLFCYPSRYESFALPILEAASVGVPVLASRVGIAPEIIPSRWLVGPNPSHEELAAGLRPRLETVREERQAIAKAAGSLRSWASWEKRADAYRTWIEGGDVVVEAPPRLTV